MANQTERFGFSTFGGDVDGSILDDSGKYTGVDRQLLDLLLAAIEQHNHRFSADDAAGPSDAPDADIGSTGALSAGLDYSYVVSFVDADGLETPAGDEVTASTPDILDPPDAPSGETATGGTLGDGAYDYALTGIRGDEQSALGDLFSITVLDDEGTVELTLPALGDADSYNVWRRKDTEGGFTLIDNTTSTSVTDDGTVPAYPFPTDPTYAPPSDNEGIDQYSFTITLSAADQAVVQNYASWRLYRTTTAGIYSAQSLVAEVTDHVVELDPESDLVVSYIDFGDTLVTGQPTAIDERMHFEPFTFEETVSLAAASGDYPENYPIVYNNGLYLSNGLGAWIQVGGASGGTDGQVLTLVSSVPQWADVPHELPVAGTTGQILAKNSGTDYDVEWISMAAGSGLDLLAPGGTTGQVLAKASNADGDVEWVDMEAGSGGGGGSTTIFDDEVGPVVATNPTPETIHTVSVPAGSAIHYTWSFSFQVTNAGSNAYAYPDSTGGAIAQYGSTISTRSSGSLVTPFTGLSDDGANIGVSTFQYCTMEGVGYNPTGSAEDCRFVFEESNAVGTAEISSSALLYWIG